MVGQEKGSNPAFGLIRRKGGIRISCAFRLFLVKASSFVMSECDKEQLGVIRFDYADYRRVRSRLTQSSQKAHGTLAALQSRLLEGFGE